MSLLLNNVYDNEIIEKVFFVLSQAWDKEKYHDIP